jgi:hypothetical protein
VCATGYGIRRSKDLRAESRKYLISTNERKNMSTKTNFKRVALVAVAALGLGVLTSVAPANAATGGTPATDKLYVSSNAATDLTPGTATTVDLGTLVADNESIGILASSGEGTTRTAVMLAGGVLNFVIGAGSNSLSSVIVDGACSITASTQGSSYGVNGKSLFVTNGAAQYVNVTMGSSAPATCTISHYSGTGTSTTVRDGGTLRNKIAVSIVAASQGGVAYAPYSYAKLSGSDITAASLATNVDDDTRYSNASVVRLGVNLNDAYGVTLGAGVLQATATGGAVVKWGSAPTSVSTASDVYTSASYATLYVSQGVTNAHKPINPTVTVSWNGAVVATKTFSIYGDAASIKVYNNVISNLGSPAATATVGIPGANYKVYDSAGNWIDEPAGLVADSSTVNGTVTGVTIDRVSQASASSWVGTSGRLNWTCNATVGGSKDVTVYLYNAQSAKISTTLPAKCAGDTYTFKVSTDKATYAPGEIITVTLSTFDAAGNPANARHNYSPVNVIASGAFASTVDTPSTADYAWDTGLDGKVSYRFIATQTEGTYSISASMPVNGSAQAATTASVTVKSTSTAVSNADVLKAIVSLIASINKQIAALQKALLKK